MRAKRKALALKEAGKSRSVKATLPPRSSEELNKGIKQEDLSRLENEGGASGKPGE